MKWLRPSEGLASPRRGAAARALAGRFAAAARALFGPLGAAAALAMLAASPALALPYELLSVQDPIEEEVRLLETEGTLPLLGLPLLTRPWQALVVEEALGERATFAAADPAALRILRALGRDFQRPAETPRSTPRLLQRSAESPEQCLELSVSLEGRAVAEEDTTYFVRASGLHGRIGASLGGWSAFSHLMAAHVPGARAFADELVSGDEDLILHAEESYLQYTAAGETWQWTAGGGRNRFAWGPGVEGSLLLSRQAAPVTALWLGASLRAWRLHLTSLAGNVASSSGGQIAAHRVEWEAAPGLRFGVAEAVRYQSQGWQPLYLVSVIPYTLVQRILVQDEPDSFAALRNNVIGAVDASWRPRPGTRLYGELLVDDLHLRSGNIPNKLGYQLGWEGVGRMGAVRFAWGGEWTRLSRFVYSSFFGATWTAQDRPLGFATGPDSRRVRTWVLWDVGRDWQLRIAAAHTLKGENDVDEPFVPGSPRVSSQRFEGQVETTRAAEATARWWPAGGVDVAATLGHRWVDDAGHVPGARERTPYGALELRLRR